MSSLQLLLAGACAALGSCSQPEALDLTALVQVHVAEKRTITNVDAFFEETEAHLRAGYDARALHAANGLWFEPEFQEEWHMKDVARDVESGMHLDQSAGNLQLNRAFAKNRGKHAAAGEYKNVLARWNEARDARAVRQGQPNNDTHWPIRADGDDASSPGTILHFSPGIAGSVSLRTEFGKWLAVAKNGTLTANTTSRDEGGSTARFFFQDHPYREVGEGNVICWKTWVGTYIGVGPNGTLAEIRAAVPGEQATKFRMARLGEDRLVLQSVDGLVVADRDAHAVEEWEAWMQEANPYQSHQLEQESGRFLERFGWSRGWVVGVIVGGFVMVTIHNILFSLSDEEEDSKVRSRGFDVARFILEYFVIYSHLAGLLGLVDWGISQWLTAYKMPAFIFITGVFGSSVAYESIAKMLCYTLGSIVLLLVLRLIEIQFIWGPDQYARQVGSNFNINDFAPGLWFLANLFVWRLIISPLFHAARRVERREVAVAGTFASLWVISFLLLGWTQDFTVWIYGNYNWLHLLFFAPFFAAGLLKTREEWDALFRRPHFQLGCAIFFLAFHILTAISGFKHWNRSTSCLPADAESCFAHLYPQAMYTGVHASAFFYDLFLFLLRLGLAVSTVCLICAATDFVEGFVPQVTSLISGWGSRTLYAYVLHVHLFNMLDKDGYIADVTSRWADGSKFVVALILAAVINVSLSTRGCEFWFHWFLRPYWLKDLLEWAVNGCPAGRDNKRLDGGASLSELLEKEEPPTDHQQEQGAPPGKPAVIEPDALAGSSEGTGQAPAEPPQRSSDVPAKV